MCDGFHGRVVVAAALGVCLACGCARRPGAGARKAPVAAPDAGKPVAPAATPQAGTQKAPVATPEAGKQEGPAVAADAGGRKAPAPEADPGGRRAAAEEPRFEPIFDGKTLAGWKAPDMSYWSVATDEEGEGVITGRSTKEHPVKSNQFLAWHPGEVADFELKLKYRIRGTRAANSGIQFRSRIAKEGHAVGYQADIDLAGGWTGALYDERGRGVLARRGQKIVIAADGKRTSTSIGDAKALWANIKKDGWNEYHITARGSHLVLKINGKVTAEVIDDHERDQDLSGSLALQLHTGPPMTVQFKDIRLRRLKTRGGKPGREAKLIAVLESNAAFKEKADACRRLARVATREAVPTLVALLDDEKLSHMARYALEAIPDAAVDAALRRALGRLKGRTLVGVIGSVGVRRDARASGTLAGLLRDGDVHVARAAARALGRIGTPAAARALADAIPGAPKGNRLAIVEGLFRHADALAAGDRRSEAMAIYDRLRGLREAPHQVRTAALRGAVLARGDAGLPLLLQALRSDDFVMVEAAARTALELPGAAVTKALADELGKLPADKQILLTLTLGKRGRAAALPALFALARTGERAARVAAIRALPEIGDASATSVLVDLQKDADDDVARAARDALATLAGPKVDAVLAAMLEDPDVATRRAAIELLGRRRVTGAIPGLLRAAKDADESIRVASMNVLRDLAGPAQFPALLGLLLKAESAAEIQAAEKALSAICLREARPDAGKVIIREAVYGDLPDGTSADVTKKVAELVKAGALSVEASNSNFGDPTPGIPKKLRVVYTVDGTTDTKSVRESQRLTITAAATPAFLTDALCTALPRAPTKPKLALLRVLRSARGAKALAAVRAAAADADAEVRKAAVSLLCGWPAPDALPDVIELAKSSTDRRVKILALRGWFRLIPLQDVPPEKKLASLKDALALTERKEEKRLALAALAAVPSPGALALVTPYLSDPELKEEACLAAAAIAEKLVGSHPALVAEAVEQVSKVTANERTRGRAKKLLGRTKPAGRK